MTIGDFILKHFIDNGHPVLVDAKGAMKYYTVRTGMKSGAGVTKYVMAYRFRLGGVGGWYVKTYRKSNGSRWEQIGPAERIETFAMHCPEKPDPEKSE